MEHKPNYMELWQENQDLKRELKLLKDQAIEVSGWKGKDSIEIYREGNVWIVMEHRKDKESGEVIEQKHTTAHRSVQVMWAIIKKLCPVINDKTKYREIVPKIIKYYRFPVHLEEFNGGKNRSKYLFPYYYYPLKVLEKLNYIRYGGSGIVTRLKK